MNGPCGASDLFGGARGAGPPTAGQQPAVRPALGRPNTRYHSNIQKSKNTNVRLGKNQKNQGTA